MSKAVMGTTAPYHAHSPSDTSSSATMSPVYPDRPIRPLPKRSLRARISPEVADAIDYPPAPNPTNPMFYIPYAEAISQRNGIAMKSSMKEQDHQELETQEDHEGDNNGSYRFKGNEAESDDDDGAGTIRRYEEYQYRQGNSFGHSRGNTKGNTRAPDPGSHSIPSSNDSVDGYDSFENTNNKKKRKIPTSGSLGNHSSSLGTTLSSDLANLGLSGSRDGDNADGGVGQYYGSGSSAIPVAASGTGISGAGRGRYGRSVRRETSGRSPLGVSVNGSNAWQTGRAPFPRRDYTPSSGNGGKPLDGPKDHGIISAAMAEAAALPSAPTGGQENISLLDQQTAKKSTPSKTQFTFTCETDSSKPIPWTGATPPPSAQPYLPPTSQAPTASQSAQNQKGFSTQGTQTSPTMAGQQTQNGRSPATQQDPQQAKPPRRSAAKRYALAARERRLQQEYNNYHHPPREEDVWICEFCEYEAIFGRPPLALIRQYEIKDRKERERLAEKRRLLEKAKMKGRKGKKANKNQVKNNAAATQSQHTTNQESYSHQPVDQTPVQNNGTQSDDLYDDGYDDDLTVPGPEVQPKAPNLGGQRPVQSTQVGRSHGTGGG